MHRPWMRNTAISCAIACGAMVAGPGVIGTSVASADLFGIDIDILDILGHQKDKKKKSDHGATVAAQQNGGGPGQAGGPGQSGSKPPRTSVGANSNGAGSNSSSQSSGPASRSAATADTPEAATFGGTGVTGGGASQAAPGAVSGGGGGGGGVPTNGSIGRAPNLAPVPTAPSSRSIVIRAEPPSAPAPAAPAAPAAPVLPAAPPPIPVVPPVVIVPPAAVAPAPSGPGGAPAAPVAPAAPSAPSTPPPGDEAISARAIPESFRIGYADYLRVASTSDLLFAVLPGIAGLVLVTAAGGVVGFRQARAAQNLPSPQIARFLP